MPQLEQEISEINVKCDCGLNAINIAMEKHQKRFLCSKIDSKCMFDEWYYYIENKWIRWNTITGEDMEKGNMLGVF